MPSPIPEELQASAQAVLDRVDGGVAAVLFGSRARDDWREDSDWDIAFITSKGDETGLDTSSFSRLRQNDYEINSLLLSEKHLEERCRYLGAVQRAIVRDGIRLAGTWRKEYLRGVQLKMDKLQYLNHINMATKHMTAACNAYADLASAQSDIVDDQTNLAHFVGQATDAAERIVKAMLVSLGVDPERTHDMSALAKQAESSGHIEEASLIRSLNGHSEKDHVASYEVYRDYQDACETAASRFTYFLPLYVRTIQGIPQMMIEKAGRETNALKALQYAVDTFETPAGNTSHRLPAVKALLAYRDVMRQSAVDALNELSLSIAESEKKPTFKSEAQRSVKR